MFRSFVDGHTEDEPSVGKCDKCHNRGGGILLKFWLRKYKSKYQISYDKAMYTYEDHGNRYVFICDTCAGSKRKENLKSSLAILTRLTLIVGGVSLLAYLFEKYTLGLTPLIWSLSIIAVAYFVYSTVKEAIRSQKSCRIMAAKDILDKEAREAGKGYYYIVDEEHQEQVAKSEKLSGRR
jgi:hypothetical protein